MPQVLVLIPHIIVNIQAFNNATVLVIQTGCTDNASSLTVVVLIPHIMFNIQAFNNASVLVIQTGCTDNASSLTVVVLIPHPHIMSMWILQ
jgi:hypothetical protein